MKPKIAIALLVLVGFGYSIARAVRSRGSGHPLVVHEWGTLVSLQGSDGIALEGLQHETELLPNFVHSSTAEYPSPFRALGDMTFDVPVRHCGGKFETPVLYFYSDDIRKVRVRVDFPHGLLTQWYPSTFDQSLILSAGTPIDLARIDRTFLTWDLELVPPRLAKDRVVPKVPSSERWGWARVPAADFVRGGGEDEQFVFYRGLGKVDLPVSVSEVGDGRVSIFDHSGDRVPAAFLIDMDGQSGSVTPLGAIAGNGQVTVTPNPKMPRAQAIAELERQVTVALVGEGLFPAEAHAMVRTWSSAWFGTNGHRVLYLIPRPETDALLPLSIEPAPDKLVRVLVGRLDYLTVADERAIDQALIDHASLDVLERWRGDAKLGALGRFLEPALRRAMATSTDPRALAAGWQILAQFR
jgi:hypothetical protein